MAEKNLVLSKEVWPNFRVEELINPQDEKVNFSWKSGYH